MGTDVAQGCEVFVFDTGQPVMGPGLGSVHVNIGVLESANPYFSGAV